MVSLERARAFSLTEAPECNICNERYCDTEEDFIPRNLSCGHSMCSKCISHYMRLSGKQKDHHGVIMICPSKCKKPTIVPDGLVKNLPKNFAVLEIIQSTKERLNSLIVPSPGRQNSLSSLRSGSLTSDPGEDYKCDVCEIVGASVVCRSCAVSLCDSCSQDIHSKKGYRLHQLTTVTEFLREETLSPQPALVENPQAAQLAESEIGQEMLDFCELHSNESLDHLCETCGTKVCVQCQLSGDHKHHECRPLVEVAAEKREVLQRTVDEVNTCYTRWNGGFDNCHELRESLFDKHRSLEASVKAHFKALQSLLSARQEKVLSELRQEVESRSTQLQRQADHLAEVCGTAKDLASECEQMMAFGEPLELAKDTNKVLSKAQQCLHKEPDAHPVVTAGMEVTFTNESNVSLLIEKIGEMKLAPNRVGNVQVKATDPSGCDLLLSWQPPSDSDSSPSEQSSLSYLAEHSIGNTNGYKSVYEGSSCQCEVLCGAGREDKLHYFRVAAVNSIGKGPYSTLVTYAQKKASFLWDQNLKHAKARISNNGYTVSIGENALWVSVGTNVVLSHGVHYWEVVLDRYGNPSLSRKVIVGVVANSANQQWKRSHGVIGIKTCPIGSRSWGLACGTARKLSSGSTIFHSFGRKHNLFREGDSVGVLLDLDKHRMEFFRNGTPLQLQFNDIYGPVIPAVSFCRNKSLTLKFPPPPETTETAPPISSNNTQTDLPGTPTKCKQEV